jgi:nitroreductase
MKQTDPPPTETAVVPEFPPPQVIAGLLMSATLAPSMHNTQPWRFRAVRACPQHRDVRSATCWTSRYDFGTAHLPV